VTTKARPLSLNSTFFASVRAGNKRSTVRKGRREVRAGDSLILTDGLDNRVAVKVTDVETKCFGELTESDADGYLPGG
jgi:hypothetical protein